MSAACHVTQTHICHCPYEQEQKKIFGSTKRNALTSCEKDAQMKLTKHVFLFSGVPRNFVRGGVQQIQLRTEDRENGDLGGGSHPSQGFWRQL